MKKIFIAGLTLCALYSCKNDDPEPEDKNARTEIDLGSLTGTVPVFQKLDPATVSENIGIANSTRVSGSPVSTSDIGTPELNDFDANESLRVAQGSEFQLPLSVSFATIDVAGYYVQVEGADEYYDIPKTSVTLQRKSFETHTKAFKQITGSGVLRRVAEDVVEIAIPESLQPGEFCVLICVYDSEGLISLPISRCIEVQSFGGEGAEFIVNNSWDFSKQTSTVIINGESKTTSMAKGESVEFNYTIDLFCEANETFEEFEYTERDKVESLVINFTSNGGMEFVTKGELYTFDVETSSCESGIVYETKTYEDLETGAWNYDVSTETMTLLFDDYTDEDGVYEEPYFIDFKAQVINDQLILSYVDDLGNGNVSAVLLYAIYFDKK